MNGENALIKVRTNCYSGTLKSTPMAIRKGISAAERVLPGVYQSYFAKGMVKQLYIREQAEPFNPL